MYITNNQSKKNFINQDICWKKFPWQKIYLRIFLITKHIYIGSKKYDLNYVYKLQKYLINCNEAKILILNKILLKVYIYYKDYKKEKFLINKKEKFNLFILLFKHNLLSCKTSNLIIEQVKQNLIYLSIEPTWKARLTIRIDNYFSIYKIKFYSFTNKNKTNDNLFINIIIKKLISYNYANKAVNDWLYRITCFDLSRLYNLKYYKCINEEFDKLYQSQIKELYNLNILLSNLFIIDFYWYLFNYIKRSYKNINIFIDSINKLYYKHYDKLIYYKLLKSLLIFFLYRHQFCGHKKINFFMNQHRILYKINCIYKEYYSYTKFFISLKLIKSCNKVVNYFIYIWLKKQRHNNLSLLAKNNNIRNINNITNKYAYICNLNKYYINNT
uniref:Reverse transcriptase N-terminal domain-containing protein n=1 Tax=Thaumatella adunca TaxID=2006976 RepID=A0A1Z1MNK3_9FLOR|nr:hypothetical protein [Thaumatella adunca]ARW67422.1 hypothetical protein [Thaumatella adunca]